MRSFPRVSLLVVLAISVATSLFAQPPHPDPLAMAKPGPEHDPLKKCVGQWDAKLTFGSGAGALTSEGTATNELTVGGRFLRTTFETKGETLSLSGVYTVGFDRRNSRYQMVAMDSLGTYFVTCHGAPGDVANVIKMYGNDDDPAFRKMGFSKEFAFEYDLRGADTMVIKVWFIDTRTPERNEIEGMTLTLTRAKSQGN